MSCIVIETHKYYDWNKCVVKKTRLKTGAGEDWTGTRAQASAKIAELEAEEYPLGFNESCRPEYRIGYADSPPWLSKGGRSKSAAKKAASRANGAKFAVIAWTRLAHGWQGVRDGVTLSSDIADERRAKASIRQRFLRIKKTGAIII